MLYLPVSLINSNNVKMAQDRIEEHARCRWLVETVVAGSIAINPFHIVLPGAHLELLAFVSYIMPKACWIFCG